MDPIVALVIVVTGLAIPVLTKNSREHKIYAAIGLFLIVPAFGLKG